jgi:hypothetical protein
MSAVLWTYCVVLLRAQPNFVFIFNDEGNSCRLLRALIVCNKSSGVPSMISPQMRTKKAEVFSMACPISWAGTKTPFGLRALIQLIVRAARYLPAISHTTPTVKMVAATPTERRRRGGGSRGTGRGWRRSGRGGLRGTLAGPGVPAREHEPEELGDEEERDCPLELFVPLVIHDEDAPLLLRFRYAFDLYFTFSPAAWAVYPTRRIEVRRM